MVHAMRQSLWLLAIAACALQGPGAAGDEHSVRFYLSRRCLPELAPTTVVVFAVRKMDAITCKGV